MSYRLRISDELYRILHAKSVGSMMSIEMVAETLLLNAIREEDRDHSERTSWSSVPPSKADEREFRLIAS